MNVVKLVTRFVLLAACVAGLAMMAVGNGSLLEDRAVARRHYDHAAAELRRVTADLNATENRLRKLTTSIHAVEWEARGQFQMVKPGERLVLLQYAGEATPAAGTQKTPSSHP